VNGSTAAPASVGRKTQHLDATSNASPGTTKAPKGKKFGEKPNAPVVDTARNKGKKNDNDKNLPSCCGCSILIADDVKALQCDRCGSDSSWKCLQCLNMTDEIYEGLKMNEGSNNVLRWFCDKCESEVFCPAVIEADAQPDSGKFDVMLGMMSRLDRLEEEMVRMKSEHLSELTKVRSEMHNMDSRQKVEECKGKVDQIAADIVQLGDRVEHCEHRPDVTSGLDEKDKGELWSDIVSRSKEVEQKISGVTDDVMILKQQTTEIREDRDEQCEIDKRRNCAIIQGLPEPTGDDGVNRKKQDEERIIDMLHEIQCDDVSVNTVIRLGRLPEADAKPRPVKIALASEAQK